MLSLVNVWDLRIMVIPCQLWVQDKFQDFTLLSLEGEGGVA